MTEPLKVDKIQTNIDPNIVFSSPISVDTIQKNHSGVIAFSSPITTYQINVNIIAKNTATNSITFSYPITLTNTTLLGTPSTGTMEFDGSFLYLSVGTTRYSLLPYACDKTRINGLTLSYVNTTTFGIAAGNCVDSTGTYLLTLPTAWTKTISAWAAGTGNGSLDTGAAGASTQYYVFLLRKDSDGSCDVTISATNTNPGLQAGYTYYKYIGAIRTDSSTHVLNFHQHGNYIFYDGIQIDRTEANVGATTIISQAVSVPLTCPGIVITLASWVTTAANHYIIFEPYNVTNTAASSTNYTYRLFANGTVVSSEEIIPMGSLADVSIRCDSATNLWAGIITIGYIDANI